MQIDGVISETPLSLQTQKAALVTSGGSFVAKQLGGFSGGVAQTLAGVGAGKLGAKIFQSEGNPAEIGRNMLEKLALNGTRFRVAVGKRILDDMIIQRLSIPEEQSTAGQLKFSCTLQQIRIVKGQHTPRVKKLTSGLKPQQKRRHNKGPV
jgi:hypothetical protein